MEHPDTVTVLAAGFDTDGVDRYRRSRRAINWDSSLGKLLEEFGVPYKSPTESPSALPRAPGLAALSPDRELLALAYSLGSICLRDFQERGLVHFSRDEEGAVGYLISNLGLDVAMLLITYSGSTLALYDS